MRLTLLLPVSLITPIPLILHTCHGSEPFENVDSSLRGSQSVRNLNVVGSIAALEIINTNTDMKLGNLFNGQVIDISNIAGMSRPAFNFNAIISGTAKSIVFGLNGDSRVHTENSAFYSFCGNDGNNFFECSKLGIGTHTVSATPYSLVDGTGVAGTKASFTFSIVNTIPSPVSPVSPPIKPPTKPPTKAPVKPPTLSPTKSPTKSPVQPPTKQPTKAPVKPPTKQPTKAPVKPPTKQPMEAPTKSPIRAGAEGITSMQLIYTGVLPHVSVMTLVANTVNVVDLSALGLPTASFNINAVRTGSIVNSVQFSNGRKETSLPYAYCGNEGPVYATCSVFVVGSATAVTVTPFPLSDQQGTPFPSISTTIQIIQGNVPVATPVAAPLRSPVTAPVPVVVPVAAPLRSPVTAPVPVPVVAPTSSPPANATSCPIPRFEGEWQGWWAGSKKYPITVAEAQGKMIGKDFVIFSGFKNDYNNVTTETYSLDMSNPAADWRRMDNMPIAEGLTHIGFVVVGFKAYMCGGYLGGSIGPHTHQCLMYDHSKAPGTGQWSTFASLPDSGRSGGGLVYDSTLNALFYAAGCTRPYPGNIFAVDHNETWMYSLSNPNAGWVPRAPIPYLGNHISFVTAKDKAGKDRHFFVGGQEAQNEEHGNVNFNYEYDTLNDRWIKHTPMPITRGHAAASTRPISCGYVIAGGISNEQGMTADVSYYDIPSGTWTSIGILSNPINTPVCIINGEWMHCETGWAAGVFSWKRRISV